eukprot:6945323-Pyramimonas_sp.AAC.1
MGHGRMCLRESGMHGPWAMVACVKEKVTCTPQVEGDGLCGIQRASARAGSAEGAEQQPEHLHCRGGAFAVAGTNRERGERIYP